MRIKTKQKFILLLYVCHQKVLHTCKLYIFSYIFILQIKRRKKKNITKNKSEGDSKTARTLAKATIKISFIDLTLWQHNVVATAAAIIIGATLYISNA